MLSVLAECSTVAKRLADVHTCIITRLKGFSIVSLLHISGCALVTRSLLGGCGFKKSRFLAAGYTESSHQVWATVNHRGAGGGATLKQAVSYTETFPQTVGYT